MQPATVSAVAGVHRQARFGRECRGHHRCAEGALLSKLANEGLAPFGHYDGERESLDCIRQLRRKPRGGERLSSAWSSRRQTLRPTPDAERQALDAGDRAENLRGERVGMTVNAIAVESGIPQRVLHS